ncbi:hypothetical protein RJ639_043662 [Escallonia herrerae]|uniref:RING-type E3 ubiquitin transferase n=1 Tax=Escallonia herrerae TaxID=1293975 RepID=A0AA88WAI9_9ASTE|nr:hypothetical protein RJ639_043662 [Escallonia herrerae]
MEHAVAEEQRQAILSGHLSRTIQSWPGRGIMWYEGYIKCLVENSVLDKANLEEDYEQYLVHTLVDQASREISTGHQSLWEISMATVELLPATESSVQALERVRYEGDGLNTTEPCAVCLDEMLLGTQVIRMPCSHIFHGECILRHRGPSNADKALHGTLPQAHRMNGVDGYGELEADEGVGTVAPRSVSLAVGGVDLESI